MADKTHLIRETAEVDRTSAGLRDALFDELNRIRRGDSNPGISNSVARLADQICNTVRLEIDVRRAAALPSIDDVEMPQALTLAAA